MNRSTEPTLSSVQQLSEQLTRLKTRYQHVSQDLRDRISNKDILELKQLEQDFLVFDIKKLERQLAKLQPSETKKPLVIQWLKSLSFRNSVEAPRRRYYVQHKPIHLL